MMIFDEQLSEKLSKLQSSSSQVAAFTHEVPLTGEEKVINCVFCKDDCSQPWQFDNNLGDDFAWAFRFPYSGPWMTLGQSERGVSYQSIQFENHVTTEACLDYWPKSTGGQGQVEKRSICSEAASRIHRFRLADLAPHEEYIYQLRTLPVSLQSEAGLDENLPGSNQTFVSQEYSFVPVPFEEPSQGWDILLFSDIQDGGEYRDAHFVFNEIALRGYDENSLVRNIQDAHFAIVPGDMVYGDEPGLWWTFFDQIRPISSKIPLMPSVGNHDTPGVGSSPINKSFRKYFDLPYESSEGAFYKFERRNLLVLAFDSERPEEFSKDTGAQYKWANETLARRKIQVIEQEQAGAHTPWTLTHWHIPCINAGARHSNRSNEFRELTALFHGVVDWHISGHEHLYQRSLPLKVQADRVEPQVMERYGTKSDAGTGYLVLPPAGNFPERGLADFTTSQMGFMRSLFAFPATIMSMQNETDSEMGFLRLRIAGNRLTISAFGLGQPGNRKNLWLRDSLSYEK